MRAVSAVGVFVAVSLAVFGIAWLVFAIASPVLGGLVLAALWSAASVFMAWLSRHADSWHPARWAVFGFLLGPFVTAYLAWQVSPKLLAVAKRAEEPS